MAYTNRIYGIHWVPLFAGALTVFLVLVLAVLLSGCATRRYVDSQDTRVLREAQSSSGEYYSNALDYTSDVEDKLNSLQRTLNRSGEIRVNMHRDRWLKELDDLEKELERVRLEILPDGKKPPNCEQGD